MVECDYCEQSFADDDAYLEHLDDAHRGELGRIDRRRVADFTGENDGGRDTGTYVLAGLGLFAAAAVGLVLVLAFTGGLSSLGGGGGGNVAAAQEPTSEFGATHEHGTMAVTIAGDQLDFSQNRYQLNANCFHFENGEGRVWHTHCTGVTLQWALGTLGIETNPDGTSVTFDGETYNESEGWNVTMEVNGDPVEPGSYELDGVTDPANVESGDHVRVVVEREE